jgi:hypothetical protein
MLWAPMLHYYKNLEEIGYNVVDWINVAQDKDPWRALMNAAMNFRVP